MRDLPPLLKKDRLVIGGYVAFERQKGVEWTKTWLTQLGLRTPGEPWTFCVVEADMGSLDFLKVAAAENNDSNKTNFVGMLSHNSVSQQCSIFMAPHPYTYSTASSWKLQCSSFPNSANKVVQYIIHANQVFHHFRYGCAGIVCKYTYT